MIDDKVTLSSTVYTMSQKRCFIFDDNFIKNCPISYNNFGIYK